MKVVMFAGAGSVGKTALMAACVALAEQSGIRVRTHKSTTRKTYEEHGFDKEKDALKDPETNRWFQKRVMHDNIAAFWEAFRIAKEDGAQVLFCDRTPHDYAAYQATVFADTMTIADIEDNRLFADMVMKNIWEDGAVDMHQVTIYMLPYPCHWSKDTQSSDGWRHDTTGKNFLWSNTVEAEVMNIQRRLQKRGLFHHHINVEHLNMFAEMSTPEVRAAIIFGELFKEGY